MYSWLIGAASPFATAEEFEGAIDGPTGGAIYTFADRPALIGVMVVVSALVFLYFIYAAFHIKSGSSTAKSPPVLGMLLVAGAASAMASLYEGVADQKASQQAARSEMAQTTQASRKLPVALLGMTGLAGVSKRKRAQKVRRRLRNR
ncbi:hypothetical protein C7271_16320 [filamentous cyanobacterium CCP5]|nr:hypothetical protein C7271_16320 [filamentous cyanobacterium CCP5]